MCENKRGDLNVTEVGLFLKTIIKQRIPNTSLPFRHKRTITLFPTFHKILEFFFNKITYNLKSNAYLTDCNFGIPNYFHWCKLGTFIKATLLTLTEHFENKLLTHFFIELELNIQ